MNQYPAVTIGQTSNFDFQGLTIRVIDRAGSPWFIAADVCCVLAHGKNSPVNSALRNLAPDEKGGDVIRTPGGPQRVMIISESGLYRLTMRSNSVAARPFQDWVTKIVLPSIRKDGGYIMGEEKVATGEMDEDTLILRAMEVLQRKVARLREENTVLAMENAYMDEELNLITVDEFRALSHLYLSQGERISLGKRATALARIRGIKLERQERILRRHGVPYEVWAADTFKGRMGVHGPVAASLAPCSLSLENIQHSIGPQG